MMNGRAHPRPQTLFFPLRGFLTCDNCGCALTSSIKKGHHYYYCTNGRRICEEHKSYLRENYLYGVVSKILGSLHFTERKIELMYKAAKEKADTEGDYFTASLDGLTPRLEALKTQESRLLDAFLGEQITKELYDQKTLGLQNERVSLVGQIKELESRSPISTLEPTKEVFLRASRAKKEFLDADDMKKRKVIEKLLWNLSIKNKSVASMSLKAPMTSSSKHPKWVKFQNCCRTRTRT